MNKRPLNTGIARLTPCIAALLLAVNSFAHQQREAYTTLAFNQKGGILEIMHRVSLHDAEHIFAQLVDYKKLGLSLDLVTDKRSQQVFAEYIESSFALAQGNQKLLPINMVGFEVEGKYLWVYQESVLPTKGPLLVKHAAMQELWPDHINHINIELDGEVQSIRLERSDMNRWRSVELL